MLKERNRRRGLKLLVGMVGVVTMTSVAYAIWETGWVHPCDSDDATEWVCQGDGEMSPRTCWCEADWDNPDNWTTLPGLGAKAVINHSNPGTGFCYLGMSPPDTPCLVDSDCGAFGTCDVETRLDLAVPDVDIAALVLSTATTSATSDSLTVKLERDGSGSKTLSAGWMEFDSTNGPLTVSMASFVGLETNSVTINAAGGQVNITGSIETD